MSQTPPPRTLRSTGPALIAVLVIAAAVLGYYQIVYYPAAAPVSTSQSFVPPNPHNSTVIIASGAGGGPSATLTYVPDTITVFIGYNATVVWKNNDTTVHTVTSNPNPPDPRFATFGPASQPYNNIQAAGQAGDTANFTFIVAGTYSYFCSYHAWMHGTVIVKAAPSGLVSSGASSSSIGVGSQILLVEILFLVISEALLFRTITRKMGLTMRKLSFF